MEITARLDAIEEMIKTVRGGIQEEEERGGSVLYSLVFCSNRVSDVILSYTVSL